MPEAIPADNVGLVTPQSATFRLPLLLECGATLPEYTLACETYGEPNVLASHHHAAGFHAMDECRPGGRDSCVGPGKPPDTHRFFISAATSCCPTCRGGRQSIASGAMMMVSSTRRVACAMPGSAPDAPCDFLYSTDLMCMARHSADMT
jgi:hypothetical protein